MPETTNANSAITNLKNAELQILLTPVYAYLTALQQPGANTQTALVGLQSLELTELAQAPLFEAVGINNVAAAIQAQIQSWQTSVVTPPSSGSGASSAAGESA